MNFLNYPKFVKLLLESSFLMPIFYFLSIIIFFIIFERYLTYITYGKVHYRFVERIEKLINDNQVDRALIICEDKKTAIAEIFKTGLSVFKNNNDCQNIDNLLELTAKVCIMKLEKRLNFLAIFANIGPMLGFLGTVLGLITAFNDISKADQVTPQLLSKGIYEAMITTVAGLIIGILSSISYNLLKTKVNNIIAKLDIASNHFIYLLNNLTKDK